jgi:hypothetical protein
MSTTATATAAPPYSSSLPALGFINRLLLTFAFDLVVRRKMDELIIR